MWFPRAWGETTSPGSVFYEGDARAFLAFAAHLQAGQPFDNGVPFHPPGWPLVVSLFFLATGRAPLADAPVDLAAVRAFVAGIGGLSVGLTAWLTYRIAGVGAMLAVAMIGTFHFGHMVLGSVANSETLYGCLLVTVLLIARRWLHAGGEPPTVATVRRDTGTRGRASAPALALGALAGFTCLVRAEFVLGTLILAAARWWAGGTIRVRLRDLLAYGAGVAIVLTPPTIWHWRSLSEFNATRAERLPGPLPTFAPITGYGPFNFANANHADADGGPNRDHPLLRAASAEEKALLEQGQLDLANPAVHRLYVDGYRIGVRWMVEHPVDALALMRRKAAITSGVFALGYLQDNRPVGVEGVRRRVDLVDPARRWLWPVHLGLTLAGAWMLWWRAPAARWILAAPLATLAASSLLFFGYVRLGAAYLPVFWILQGAAVAAAAGRLPWPSGVRARVPLLVATLGLVLAALEGTGADRSRVIVFEGSVRPDGRVMLDETVQVRNPR